MSHEASSPAGHQRLDNLAVLRDDNRIPGEGDTAVAVPEEVPARHRAHGRPVRQVGRTAGGTHTEDVPALHRALTAVREETDRPSPAVLRSGPGLLRGAPGGALPGLHPESQPFGGGPLRGAYGRGPERTRRARSPARGLRFIELSDRTGNTSMRVCFHGAR